MASRSSVLLTVKAPNSSEGGAVPRSPRNREPVERRSEPRFECQAEAELTIVDRAITTIPAVVRDVSKSGLRIAADTPMNPGTQVRIKMDSLTVFGEVRYCHAKGKLFESGVRTRNVVTSSEIQPHLRDDQVDLLAIGRGLSFLERFYAKRHIQHCPSCAASLTATRQFFERLRQEPITV